MSSLTKAPRAPTGGGGLIFSGFGSSFGSGFGTRFLRFGFSFGFSVTSNSSNSLSDFRSAWFEISSFSTFWEISVCSTSTLSTSGFWIQRTQWSLETQRQQCHVVTFTSYEKIKLKPEIGRIPRNGFNRVQNLIFVSPLIHTILITGDTGFFWIRFNFDPRKPTTVHKTFKFKPFLATNILTK